MEPGRRSRIVTRTVALVGVAAATLVGSACGLDNGSARTTLPPLPPPVGAALITAAPAPVTQPPTATTLAPGETLPADDANPTSVAQRFLTAAANNDAATGEALRIADRDPDVFGWAVGTHNSTVSVAGDAAWGSPVCAEAAGPSTTCTWLLNDPTVSLVLVQDGGNWRVSHPVMVPTGPGGDPAGTACIVGGDPINMRGGPGTNWPRFQKVGPGTCGITIYGTPVDGPDGPWRMVEVNGARGWMVDRVLGT